VFAGGLLFPGSICRHLAESVGDGCLGSFPAQDAIVDVLQAIKREVGLIFV